MSFIQYLRKEHFRSKIWLYLHRSRWQQTLFSDWPGTVGPCLHLLAKLPRPQSEIKICFFFLHQRLLQWLFCHFLYFQNKSLVVRKMVLSKKTHDKGAADVFTVPRLKTSIAPVVSVVFLPRRHEWTEVKTKQSSPLSSLSVWGLVWGVICNPIQSNHKWRTENTTPSSSLQNYSSHQSLP